MTALAADARAARVAEPRRATSALLWVAAIVIVGGVATALLFRFTGGSWFIVETPSMGTAAPVGTLLVDRPAAVADLRVGDVITFRPPTAPAEIYSHRVVRIVGDGVLTRGDINGANDGWVVHQRDLIGRAAAVLPIVGWIVRALPILVAGVLLTVLATRWPRGPRRTIARLMGASVAVALAAAWLHPFAGMVLLQTAVDRSAIVATVVGTGLLPVTVRAAGGATTRLDPGQVGLLRITGVAPGHRIELASSLDLPWWGWALLATVCVTPLLAGLAVLARHRLLGRWRREPA